MRYFFVIWLFITLASSSFAEKSTAPDSFVTGAFSLPSGVVLLPATRDEKGEVIPSAKIRKPVNSEAYYGSRVFDVTDAIKDWGVEFPAGTLAIYLDDTDILILKSSPQAIQEFASLTEPCQLGAGLPSIRSQISVFAFRVAGLTELPRSFAALKEAAGESWKEEFSTTILAKSGQNVSAAISSGKQPFPADIVSFSENQTGCLISLDTSVAPDWWNMESSAELRYRGKDPKSEEFFEFTFDGLVQLWCGQSQVLQVVQTSPGQYRALVLRSEFVLPNSFPLEREAP